MAARGLDEADARGLQALAQVFGGAQAVAQVVLLQALLQAHGQRLQVAPGHAAVGGKPSIMIRSLRTSSSHSSERSTMKPPMLTMPSFLALMVAPSA
jgi:hypothetical protein